jgi:hypothetical protein
MDALFQTIIVLGVNQRQAKHVMSLKLKIITKQKREEFEGDFSTLRGVQIPPRTITEYP